MRGRKYDPLKRHLQRRSPPFEMTFSDIASLAGTLPQSAFRYREWWSNNPSGHVQAAAWLSCGRRVAMVDLARQRVRFE